MKTFEKLILISIVALISLGACASHKPDTGSTEVAGSGTSDATDVNDADVEGDIEGGIENEDEFDEDFEEGDPLEGMNRAIYSFNTSVDRFLLKPVTKQYVKLPSYMRRRVSSFFSNLTEPTTVANDLLQGKWLQAVEDSTRFVVNSTAGILGLFDVASHVDLPKNDEDFGQTLATWGIGEGPYLMLPILGPSNFRDTAGVVTEYFTTDPISGLDSTGARWGVRGVDAIDTRAGLLRADKILDMQLDPYIFLRESYRQKRDQLIWDGKPPEE